MGMRMRQSGLDLKKEKEEREMAMEDGENEDEATNRPDYRVWRWLAVATIVTMVALIALGIARL